MDYSIAMFDSTRKVLVCFFFLLLTSIAIAQVTNTGSPYSRYGLGDRESLGYSKSQGMGGVAYGICDKNMVNATNPASFTSQDSMSFILDIALKGRYQFSQSGKDQKHRDGAMNIHHVAMQMPAGKYFGLALGFQPYSQMGYTVVRYETDLQLLSKIGNVRYRHHGNGGLSEAFAGFAYSPFKYLSVGVSGRFLFGSLNYSQDMYVPHHALYADVRYDDRWVLRGFGLTAGIQALIPLREAEVIRFGAVVEMFPSLTAERRKDVSQVYLNTSYRVINNYKASDEKLKFPMKFGAGLLYESPTWSYGIDFSYQDWSTFSMRDDQLYTKTLTINGGVQWIPNPTDIRFYLNRVQYRMGVYYEQLPMLLSNTQISNMGITLGLGFPYKYTQSVFHTTFRLGQRGTLSNSLIREWYGEVLLGVSFNDIWFVKRKFQ